MTAPDWQSLRQQFEAAVAQAFPDGLEEWQKQCHAASLHLVRSGVLGKPGPGPTRWRVARGVAAGVGGQHSWAVCGDPYDPMNLIVDVTLWSYDESRPKVWLGNMMAKIHRPHGLGGIQGWGIPEPGLGPRIVLKQPRGGWTRDARLFLNRVEPLDALGWARLAHAPMQGWPAKEIVTQMCFEEEIAPRIPIDIVGMVTDLNPGKGYW